jgi:hypothetical protein
MSRQIFCDNVNNIISNYQTDSNKVRVLAWDIGIKNLSYSVVEYDREMNSKQLQTSTRKYNIIDWDVFDLTDSKQCNLCLRQAKWSVKEEDGGGWCCGIHHRKGRGEKIPEQKTDVLSLHLSVTRALDKKPELCDVEYVVLENQPPLNLKMKTIAAAIFEYYVIKCITDPIKMGLRLRVREILYMRATEKMKIYNGPLLLCPRKTKKDKWLAIRHCWWELLHHTNDGVKWKTFFMRHSKKDDLADSFLTGVAFLKRKLKILY